MNLDVSGNSGDSRKIAWVLALAGFIPFGAIAISIFFMGGTHPAAATVTEYFKIWSVVILSFLGGIRWGLSIGSEPFDRKSMVLSVIPAIFGWLALLLPDLLAVLCLLFLFCAQGAWDSFAVNQGKAPPWFGSIRVVLTFLVAAAHLIVAFAVA